MPPKKQDFGVLAEFVDSEGAPCSVGADTPNTCIRSYRKDLPENRYPVDI